MSAQPGIARASNRGFSLIEVMLCIGLLALLCGMGAHSIGRETLSRWRSRQAASEVMGVLRKAKWLAISENREYGVRFYREGCSGPWTAALLRRQGGWLPAEAPKPLPAEVTRLALSGSEVKEFNPDGTSGSGSVVISCRNGRSFRISLTASTGRIRLYRGGE